MASQSAFLNSILALSTDHYAVLRVILEQITRAECDGHFAYDAQDTRMVVKNWGEAVGLLMAA